MATILQIVNRILPEINLPTLTALVGNTNQTAVRTLALANREGRELATHPWRILIKRHIFTTVSSADAYGLPSDFRQFVDGTFWNDDNDEIAFGPVGDQRWQADLSGLTTTYINDRWQLRADGNSNKIFLRPEPTSAEDLTFFYVSDGWCRTKSGTRKTEWSADTDVLLLPELVYELGLKVRLLRAQRRDFTLELAEYQRELNKEKARDGGMETVRILGPSDDAFYPGRIPDTGFGS